MGVTGSIPACFGWLFYFRMWPRAYTLFWEEVKDDGKFCHFFFISSIRSYNKWSDIHHFMRVAKSQESRKNLSPLIWSWRRQITQFKVKNVGAATQESIPWPTHLPYARCSMAKFTVFTQFLFILDMILLFIWIFTFVHYVSLTFISLSVRKNHLPSVFEHLFLGPFSSEMVQSKF